MPGTLLASDWQQSVEDNLRQAADDAIARARASATATIAPVQQAVQQVAPDPQAVAAQLHAYVDQIQPAAQQLGQNVAGAATTVLGGAQDAASDVADQLHQHVNNLVANGGGQPSVQALGGPPTPGETPTNNQGVVTSLGGTQPAPPNTADVSGPVGGAPSSDTTQSGMGAIDASSPSAFARSFAPYAQYAAQKLGIDPTWVAAMAASESNYGKADAAGHELFGVKALPGQPGTTLATHEGENGGTNMDQTFAAYDSPLDSVNAWIDLIKNHYKGAVGAPDLQTFVHGLKQGGYFTAGEGEYLGIVKGIASNIGNDVQAGLQAAGTGKPSVATTPPVTTAQARAADLGYTDISQFGDKQLTQAEAYAACGPAAAVRFAEKFGRNPTLREATDLASSVGWTTANGMAGISSQKALMDKLGVPTHIVQGPQWDAFAAEAQTGNPVTISTSGKNGGHYFFADGYNPDTGAFHVGQSGKDLKGGSEWMTPDQMQSLMGQAQGALFADNPASPVQSSAAGNKPTPLGGDSSAVSQPATVNGQTPRSATPIVMGGLQDAAGNVLGGAANAVGGAASAVGSVANDIRNAAAPVLGGAASAVGGALDSTARGAQDVLASTSRDVTNALGVIQQTAADIAPNLGGNDQELARRRAALEQNPAVLGGVGGEASTGPPGEQTPQTVLGGVARAATGIGMPPTDQVQSPAEIAAVQKETTEPITTANPLNRVVLPGQTAPVPVIGGLSNMLIEQAFANPLVFVPGAPLGEALNSVGKQVLEEVAPNAPALLARFGTGAINGLLQNGIIAAGDKDATPQSVGEAMAQGAVGGALIEGVPGGALKLGQAIVRHLPDLQPILERAAGSARTLATDESGALKLSPSAPEPVPTPTEPRTPITEGGLGTPRYEYPTGSTPQTISDTLRGAAETDPTGVAHLDSAAMTDLPSMPRMTTPDGAPAPAWQKGIAPHLDDLRYAQDVGMPQAQWYSDFAQQVARVVGDKNVNEFRTLFGITSQQTPPTENLQYTLGLMRMAREFTANGTDFTVPNIKTWIAQNPRVTSLGTEGAKWKMNSDQFKKVVQLYTTGQVKVATNAKTSSYASNILSALHNRFDPNSTMDTWMAQIFNYRVPNRTASSDQAFQAMRTVVDHLAGETGQVPHQAQAAMWFAIKGAKDFAASKAASPQLKGLVKGFTNGTNTLREVLDQAKAEGAYDNLSGTWDEVSRDKGVASELQKLQPHLAADAARPDIADSGYLYYPGKGRPLAGVPGARASAVTPETTGYRAGAAERQAGVAEIDLPQAVQEKLGYDADTRQFSALRGVPHEVQGDQVMVPGGNMDTLKYVAARIHEAAGEDATPATLYTYRPESPEHVGWQISDIPPDRKAQLLDDLRASGVGHQELNDGTLGVNALPVRDAEYENAIADAVARAGATVEGLNGHVQTVSPGQSSESIGRYGARYGAADVGGLPESGSGLAGAAVARSAAGDRVPGAVNAAGFRAPAVGPGERGVPGAAGGTSARDLSGLGFDDLTPRSVSQAEARQLVGPAFDPSGRTTARPPGEGGAEGEATPRRLEDVESNPHLLREPAEGETPMTADERQAHQDNLVDRFGTNQQRLDAIEEQLANPKAKPERPPWAAGFTNDQVATMAAKVGRSPFEPLWWEKAGLESGSGEVREMLNESGINRGDLNASREPTPAELRQEQRELQQDQRHIEAAGDQLATAPVNARFAKPPDRNAAPLPFEHTTADPGADLAQQVVLKKGTLTSDPNEVTATNAAGVTGRGILNPAEVVHEPPSAETKALMPNLSAIGKDMPETIAQIQKSVEDNQALWEHYKQGTISFDSLKNDLARRVGMTKEDWLKTKVGQAFNDREMVALQAAMIEEEARQTDLAKSIMAKGGVDALSPEELAYSMASLTEAQSLAAVAKGAGSTSGRSLNARKVSFTRQLASDITAANERKAAQRTKAQAQRVASRADTLLQRTRELEKERDALIARLQGKTNIPEEARGAAPEGPVVQEQMPGTPAAASRPGQAGAPQAPKSIIDQIAAAYDELDRYNALSLHEKEGVFNKLQEQRAAQAAARAARVRGAPEELLAQLRKELQWEQNNFAKRKDTWETMAFQDSKAAENAAAKRAGFRGGLYIEQQRKVANIALDAAQKETDRAFDAELKRRGQQSNKAQKLLESMGGQEVTKDVLKNYLAALNDPDPVVAAKFLQATASMSNWKRATVVRLAGLVSSPITMMVNIGGNAASALYEVPTHVLAGGIDLARVAAAGGERQIYGGDILSMAKAYGPGFLGQLDNAKRILTTGFTPEQLADPKKIRGAFSRWGGLNTAVEAPLRILGASDALFRGGAMAAHGTRVAMRQARAEGFSGPQVAGRAATILKNLEDYPELAKETADAAARQVYQERRPVLGGGNVGIENDVKEFATKQFLPFYQTPMNVTAQGVAMSPLGGVSTLQSALKARNMPTGTLAERSARGREIQLAEERAARALIGTGVLGAGIALGNAGHLTGAYPQDPTEASTLPQGWRPWSIKVDSPIDGNTYYVPMQNLNAAGFPMAMAAILTDPIHRGKTLADPDEQLNAVTAIGRYVLDNTFLQGLSDLVNTLHDPKTFAQKTGESLVSSYGPYSSLGREFQRVAGVATRNPHEGFTGLWEAMEANYPGASGNVPPARTPLGDERTQAATGIARTLPLRYDIERDEPTLKALRESGVGIPPTPKSINAVGGHIDMTEEEQAQYVQARGALIRQAIAPYAGNPAFEKLTTGEKNKYMRQVMTEVNTNARNQFLATLGKDEVTRRWQAKEVPDPYYLGSPT